MSKRKKNNIIIGSLLAIVLLMVVGYAAFSSALNISGTGSITSSWNIKITNVEVSNIVGDASDGVGTTYEDLTATINSNLVSPGDSITYDVTVRNDGSLDAVLTDINLSESTNPAISFSTSNLEAGAELKTGEEAILKVTITYNDVTSQPENTSANLNVTLTYEQKGSETIIPGGDTVNMGGQDVEVVSSGDGLYEDEYEEGRYIYKGADPDNYITFSGETWRIISVENDGTIKIMRSESIGNRAWDSSNSNNWARPATLNTYLNEEYLPTLSDSDKVVSHNFSIGTVTYNNEDLATQINNEDEILWNGKVGLITVSEYLRANPNVGQCGNLSLNNTNSEICATTNWITPPNGYLWLISFTLRGNSFNYRLQNDGWVGDSSHSNASNGIAPALYLSSDIALSGAGTQSDPYQIS